MVGDVGSRRSDRAPGPGEDKEGACPGGLIVWRRAAARPPPEAEVRRRASRVGGWQGSPRQVSVGEAWRERLLRGCCEVKCRA